MWSVAVVEPSLAMTVPTRNVAGNEHMSMLRIPQGLSLGLSGNGGAGGGVDGALSAAMAAIANAQQQGPPPACASGGPAMGGPGVAAGSGRGGIEAAGLGNRAPGPSPRSFRPSSFNPPPSAGTDGTAAANSNGGGGGVSGNGLAAIKLQLGGSGAFRPPSRTGS